MVEVDRLIELKCNEKKEIVIAHLGFSMKPEQIEEVGEPRILSFFTSPIDARSNPIRTSLLHEAKYATLAPENANAYLRKTDVKQIPPHQNYTTLIQFYKIDELSKRTGSLLKACAYNKTNP